MYGRWKDGACAAALLYFLALGIVVIGFGIGQDRLLFRSSFLEIATFVGATALILWLPLAALLALFSLLRSRRNTQSYTNERLARLCVTVLLFGFGVYAVDALLTIPDYLFQWNDHLAGTGRFGFFIKAMDAVLEILESAVGSVDLFSKRGDAIAAVVCLALGGILSLYIVRRLPDWNQVQRSVTQLAVAVAVSALVFTAGNSFFREQRDSHVVDVAASADHSRQNLIFIVIDGLGAEYLPVYNPGVRNPDFEEIADGARLYLGARTNHPFTNGFFSILYTGRLDAAPSEQNLWNLLQERGVRTRWIAAHNNGVPDTYDLPYRGLRSAYLTEGYRWIPALSGLDYNVFRYRGLLSRGTPMGNRELAFAYLSNLPFAGRTKNVLEETLIEEVEALRSEPGRHFLLVHTEGKPGQPLWRWWNPDVDWLSDEASPNAALNDAIDDNDNVYPPDAQATIDTWRKWHQEVAVATAIKSLAVVFRAYRERGWDRDTTIIVTADHGNMMGKGKVGYHYHADEEALRVPLVVAGPDLAGRDERLLETIDLTRSVLDYFGVDAALAPGAISLFDANAHKDWTSTLTEPSRVRGEWLLAVNRPGEKWVIDLLDDHQTPRHYHVQGFEALPSDGEAVANLPLNLEQLVATYGAEAEVKEWREKPKRADP